MKTHPADALPVECIFNCQLQYEDEFQKVDCHESLNSTRLKVDFAIIMQWAGLRLYTYGRIISRLDFVYETQGR